MKKILTFSLLCISVIVLVGCRGAKMKKVGVSISNQSNPFFVTLVDGIESESADNNDIELIVLDAQDDSAKQTNDIDDLIAQKVTVIIINPVDSDSIGTAVSAANDANIPVITVDRGSNSGDVTTHIASDNVAGGVMAGEYMLELLGDNAATAVVLELQGITGTSAAIDRGAGFTQAVSGKVENVIQAVANFNRAEGLNVMNDKLISDPNIVAVFAHNDEMALGAYEAISSAGKQDEIIVIGFDAIDDAKASVEADELKATIEQQPSLMGQLAFQNALKIINNETVEENVPVSLKLIKK